jgi:putative DNA primase/helicase
MNAPEDFPYITTIFCRPERETHLTALEGPPLFDRLRDNDYHPMPLKAQTKQPELKQWPLKAARGEFSWMQSRPGVGLLCGYTEPDPENKQKPWRNLIRPGDLLALDFDLNKKPEGCDAPTLSLDEQMQVRRAIGGTPTVARLVQGQALVRTRGGAANFIVALRNDGSIENGAWRFSRDGKPAIEIEILASGRQFAAFAIHPAGGAYQWLGDLSPETMPLDKLPTLTSADLDQLRAEIAEALRPLGLTEEGRTRGAARPGGKQNGVGVAEKLLGEFSRDAAMDAPPIAEMRILLAFLAARNAFVHREGVETDAAGRIIKLGWREAGMALKLSYGDEVGYALWEITHDSEQARAEGPAQWASFAAEPSEVGEDITVRTICRAALDAGFSFKERRLKTALAVENVGAEVAGVAPNNVDNLSFTGEGGDTYNGATFASFYRDKILFIHETNEVLRFDEGGGWLATAPGTAERAAKAVMRALKDVAHGKAQLAHVTRLCDARAQRAMIEMAKSEPGMTARLTDFDNDPMLLGVKNGVLDLARGVLIPVSPTVLVSKRCNAAYAPEATCPRFERFMSEVQPDAEMRAFLQRWFGLCLTGDASAQAFAFFYGEGFNGKGVLIENFSWLLGDYADKIETEMLMTHQRNPQGPSPDVMALKGRRFVYANETEEGQRLSGARIKDMTGDDSLTGRPPHGKANIKFRPTHKLVIAGNHKPEITDMSLGMWRRVLLVPFERVIPATARDLGLLEKLKREGAGILNWALAGLRAYQQGGLQTPAKVAGATAAYREEQDILGEFLAEKCDTGGGLWTAKRALYSTYVFWANENGYKPLAQGRLTRRLNERGLPLASDKRTVKGLDLKSEKKDEPATPIANFLAEKGRRR